MTLFETWDHAEFDDDESVLWHELAHLTTWYTLGQAIGRLRLTRGHSGLLNGGSQAAARDPSEPQSTEYLEKFAERQLAAESAVRRLHGLPLDRICISVNGITARHTVAQIQGLLDLPRESDISRALGAADLAADGAWYEWLKHRLDATVGILDSNWEALAKLTATYRVSLPAQADESMIVWGFELLQAFREAGVRSGVVAAIEVVARLDQGDVAVRTKREELHTLMGSEYRVDA